jgi:hypothetical protein
MILTPLPPATSGPAAPPARSPCPAARAAALLALALAGGCPDAAVRRPDPASSPAQTKGKDAMNQPVHMVDGPAIQPSGALLDWLGKNATNAAGKRRLFRLPVVVRFEDSYRLALGPAFIGVSEGAPPADAIPLTLDDTGLKSALLDTLRDRCPKEAGGCALWLDGYWGALVDAPGLPGEAPPKNPFAVLRVGEMIDGKAQGAAAARAQVEPGE